MATEHTAGRKILVLVGPPGVGKKFCTLRLNGNHPMDIDILKTLTTQPQRQIYDSLFYKTVSLEVFQKRLAEGALIESDEFAGHWYGIVRADAEAILKQQHAVVSATPSGATALRRSGFSTVIASLVPLSKTLVEVNLRRKQETPDRLELMRQAGKIYQDVPDESFDLIVGVGSLEQGERELEQKLLSYMELH